METQRTSGCLLLITGIPGSGKSTLSRALLGHSRAELHQTDWIPLAVHFDDFYPPDLRLERSDPLKEEVKDHFDWKDARHKVLTCIEYFIFTNSLGSRIHTAMASGHTHEHRSADHLLQSRPSFSPREWDKFVHYINKHAKISTGENNVLSVDGRINTAFHAKSVILVLDDNMPLRSMRYEYYQLARKYGLGFAQICVQCTSQVAKLRNVHRSIPILDSTIEYMEQSMEYPEPNSNHWEVNSLIVSSETRTIEEFIHTGCEKIRPLIKSALSNPVPPLPKVDTALKESCQVANIDSYVHQADIILRRCVSLQLEKHSSEVSCSKEEKIKLARNANAVRKRLLDEIRAGMVCGDKVHPQSIGQAQSDHFKQLVEESFLKLLTDIS